LKACAQTLVKLNWRRCNPLHCSPARWRSRRGAQAPGPKGRGVANPSAQRHLNLSLSPPAAGPFETVAKDILATQVGLWSACRSNVPVEFGGTPSRVFGPCQLLPLIPSVSSALRLSPRRRGTSSRRSRCFGKSCGQRSMAPPLPLPGSDRRPLNLHQFGASAPNWCGRELRTPKC